MNYEYNMLTFYAVSTYSLSATLLILHLMPFVTHQSTAKIAVLKT